MSSREEFEDWVSGNTRWSTSKFGPHTSWPGEYVVDAVTLAWEAWQARESELEEVREQLNEAWAESNEWERTARRLGADAGYNADYMRPDEGAEW